MKLTKRSLSRLLMVAVGFGMLLALGIPVWGQEAPEPITVGNVWVTGLPDDWSHHHVVFSNPGTEQEALDKGTYDQWLKIVNDPRYITQQLKRRSPAQGPAAEDVARIEEMARAQEAARGEELAAREVPDPLAIAKPKPVKPPKATIKRDWSMNMGPTATVGAGMYPAKYSFTTSNANCGSATTPDFVVYNTSVAGSAEVAASQTGSFTGQPAGAQTVTIGGTEVLTASAPIAASATGTFSGTPATSSTLTITGSGNTLILTAGGAGNQSGSCTLSGGKYTADFASGGSYFTNLINMINTGGCGSEVGVSASGTSSNLTITATTPGAAGNSITLQTTSSPNFHIAAWTTATNLAGGLDALNTGTNFAIGAADTDTATNLASAITHNGGTVGVSATSGGTTTVTVTAMTPGVAGDSITLAETLSNFTWAGSTLASGTDGETIIAYDNLYSGCSGNVPTTYWEYNTAYPQGSATGDSSTVTTSVTSSWDGSQVAFVESNSSNFASLVVLKWAGGSSVVQMDTASNNVVPSSYRGCSAPCMTRITFNGSHNDTNSPPFYDYTTNSDTLYVGDDSGYLHKFTGVFNGTPAEAGSPWPVSVGTMLSGPIYDVKSTLVFVGDSSGYLYSVDSTTGAKITSGEVAKSPGIVDAPLVDSTTEKVYVFVGRDMNGSNPSSPCGDTNACDGVVQFNTSFISKSTGVSESVMGVTSSENVIYAGAFDNIYWTESTAGTGGNLYVCGSNGSGYPLLMKIPISSTDTIPGIATTIDTITNGATTCSPVTEIYNGSTDYIFLSVSADGDLSPTGTTCTGTGGACVYSWDVTTALAKGAAPTSGLGAAGGTSAIIIDNTSGTSGTSQVYFGTLSSGSCSGATSPSGSGSGTGGCAVQASQSGLN